jgi:hypothetical protein
MASQPWPDPMEGSVRFCAVHSSWPWRGWAEVTYSPRNVCITDALNILKARGVTRPGEELLQALRDGEIIAEGLVAWHNDRSSAGWRVLDRTWWHHVNSPLESNVVWFNRASTDPATPFRAEELEVPRAAIDRLWPEAAKNRRGAAREGAPQSRRSVGAKTRGVQEAIDHLWPNGIPPGLSPKERNNKIIDHIDHNGGSIPSTRTIERVLQTRTAHP